MNRTALKSALIGATMALFAGTAIAEPSVSPREGWRVIETDYSFDTLSERLFAAIKDAKMIQLYTASASKGAAGRGITIPGNRVVGVYRNDFAVRMLDASISAGMEAPIEFYLTEDADGGATLSYKTPTFLFSPYFDEGGDKLKELAADLDAVFGEIAGAATAN